MINTKLKYLNLVSYSHLISMYYKCRNKTCFNVLYINIVNHTRFLINVLV